MAGGTSRIHDLVLNRQTTPQDVARSALVRLREAKENGAGWNQSELARRVGTTPTQIRKLENGDLNISLEWMDRLARAMGVKMSAFLAPDQIDIPADSHTSAILAIVQELPPTQRVSLVRAAVEVMGAARSLSAEQSGVALQGSPAVAAEVARAWQGMDERQRRNAAELMQAAGQMAPRA